MIMLKETDFDCVSYETTNLKQIDNISPVSLSSFYTWSYTEHLTENWAHIKNLMSVPI